MPWYGVVYLVHSDIGGTAGLDVALEVAGPLFVLLKGIHAPAAIQQCCTIAINSMCDVARWQSMQRGYPPPPPPPTTFLLSSLCLASSLLLCVPLAHIESTVSQSDLSFFLVAAQHGRNIARMQKRRGPREKDNAYGAYKVDDNGTYWQTLD